MLKLNTRFTQNKSQVIQIVALLGCLGGISSPLLAQNCSPVEMAKVIPADTQTLDRFGRAVSISGDYAIIGAYHDDDHGLKSGSAYIYHFDGVSWNQVQKIVPADVGLDDRFGTSVSISGDVAIIGCVYDSDLGSRSGSAYIYRNSTAGWVLESKITASDGAIDDRFGRSVSIQGDAAVVGAIWDDDNGIDSGSAYVFRFDGTTWNQEAKIIASDGATLDKFGWSVSMSQDELIVGAKWNDALGLDSGAAYIYRYDGTTWAQEAKLIPSDGAADSHFGYSISLDGDVAVIGTTWDGELGLKAGAAYVFRFDGSTWGQETKLLGDDEAANDRFGFSVSVDSDRILVGSYAHMDNGLDAGSAYVYMYDGAGWVQQPELLASDGGIGDHFGRSVSLSGDTMLVGAYFDADVGLEAGSAYFFDTNCPLPCDADFTGDGILNFFDVSAFLAAFTAQDPATDLSGDGVYNFFDVSAYLQLFAAGCP